MAFWFSSAMLLLIVFASRGHCADHFVPLNIGEHSEGLCVWDSSTSKGWPGVLLLTTEGSNANEWRREASEISDYRFIVLATNPYVMTISRKGSNGAQVNEAVADTASLHEARQIALAALDSLKRHPLIDPSRISIVGIGQGSRVALELGIGASASTIKWIACFDAATADWNNIAMTKGPVRVPVYVLTDTTDVSRTQEIISSLDAVGSNRGTIFVADSLSANQPMYTRFRSVLRAGHLWK